MAVVSDQTALDVGDIIGAVLERWYLDLEAHPAFSCKLLGRVVPFWPNGSELVLV